MCPANRQGVSLIEAIIVLVVVGILLTIASPLHREVTTEARGVVTRSHLREVLLAELTYFSKHNGFTTDRAELLAIDPSLQLGEAGRSGSIYIIVARSKEAPAVCLFAEGVSNDWQTLYYSGATDTAVQLHTPNDCTRHMLEEQRSPGTFEINGNMADTLRSGSLVGRVSK